VEIVGLLLIELTEETLQQYLREPNDRVERRAQLVRHVREELGLVAVRRLQVGVQPTELVVHAIDVRRQRPQLIAVVDADVAREIAGGDALDTGADRADRPDDREAQREAEDECKGEAQSSEREHDALRPRVGLAVVLDALHDIGLRSIHELTREPLEPIGHGCDLRGLHALRLHGVAGLHKIEGLCVQRRELIVRRDDARDEVALPARDELKAIDAVSGEPELPDGRIDDLRIGSGERRLDGVQLAASSRAARPHPPRCGAADQRPAARGH